SSLHSASFLAPSSAIFNLKSSYTFSGTSKGSCGHLLLALVNIASSSPNGAPCDADDADLLGEPKPITVLISIRVGCFLFLCASSNAFLISLKSLPSSTLITCQLYASKRACLSSDNAISEAPANEMSFES